MPVYPATCIHKQNSDLSIYLSAAAAAADNRPSPHRRQFQSSHPFEQRLRNLYYLHPETKHPKTTTTMSLPSSGNQPQQNTTYSSTTAASASTNSSSTANTTTPRTNQTPNTIHPSRTSAATNPDHGPDSGLENGSLSRAEAERMYEEQMEEEYAKREGGA